MFRGRRGTGSVPGLLATIIYLYTIKQKNAIKKINWVRGSDGVRKKSWGGTRAVKVPIGNGVQESLQTMPIVLLKKTRKKGHGFYRVPTVHGSLGANGGLAKSRGL